MENREIKRVPITFDWPLKTIWEGYKNPWGEFIKDCSFCARTGYSVEAKVLYDQWYGNTFFCPEMTGSTPFLSTNSEIIDKAKRNINYALKRNSDTNLTNIFMEAQRLADLFNRQWCHHINDNDVAALLAANRLVDFTHVWEEGKGWIKKNPKYVPSVKEVNLWSIDGIGHDSINSWVCVAAKAARLGFDVRCPHCDGDGEQYASQDIKKSYDQWKPFDPPQGDGYQLWETTSEGSPISPVFSFLNELCEWAETNATIFGNEKWSKNQWIEAFKEK